MIDTNAELYHTKYSLNDRATEPGPGLVEVTHLPDGLVRMVIKSVARGSNGTPIVVSDATFPADLFADHILPLLTKQGIPLE